MAPGMRYWPGCSALLRLPRPSIGPWRWTPRSLGHTNTPRTSPATQGAGSNYNNPGVEPPDHGIGRSRGGLTSKIHHLVDGAGRPLVVLVSPGQTNDAPLFEHLLAPLRVDRPGRGRPRTRPDRLRGDKAYSSRAIRAELRRRGITAVIPSPQTRSPTACAEAHAADGRPASTPRTTRDATSSNVVSTSPSSGVAWPPDTTNSPSSTAAAPYCEPSQSGQPIY